MAIFEAGEVLVRLEDEDYRLAVTRAEALVAQRQQALIREQAEGLACRRRVAGLSDAAKAYLPPLPCVSRNWPKATRAQLGCRRSRAARGPVLPCHAPASPPRSMAVSARSWLISASMSGRARAIRRGVLHR